MKNGEGIMSTYAVLVAIFYSLIVYAIAQHDCVYAITIASLTGFFFIALFFQRIIRIEKNLRSLMKQKEEERIANKSVEEDND